jgi:uracil-DNA glycosylase
MSFLKEKEFLQHVMVNLNNSELLFKCLPLNLHILDSVCTLKEESEKEIYPYLNNNVLFNLFKAFTFIKNNDVKVVILGQDPYYTKGTCVKTNKNIPYATGLAFGVPKTISKIPPSLKNILKEANSRNTDYSLESWAKQGVLLLNTALTVEDNNPGVHIKFWEKEISQLIEKISITFPDTIFLLWGNHAKSYRKHIKKYNCYVLESSHPSPLSASKGFLGCGHFKKVNKILYKLEKNKIIW